MGNLSDRLHNAPFVRLLVPFIAGIILAEWFLPEKNWFYLAIPITFALLLFLFRKGSFNYESAYGLLLLMTFFFLGFSLAVNLKYVPKSLTGDKYYALLDEFPVEKDKSFKAIIRLIDPEIKVIAYFEKSDEIAVAQPGTLLYFTGCPELILNRGNPFEFDYKNYSIRNKIGHRIYLKSKCYLFLHTPKILNLQHRFLMLREKLLRILGDNGIKGETFHVISAITLGARDNLDPETTQSFIKTGTIHVLAVSGMNVAIIFIVLDLLMRFLKRHRAGVLLHTLIIIGGIWGYAMITGLSPSVLRAATMFTFIVAGNNLSRRPNVYNSLAASAFILMCINPSLLFDVGFQLSYAAVFAIVFIQPVLYKYIYFKYWILDRTWLYLTVAVAAQLGTLPLSLYYFHQFPNYFWLTNMIVVPLVSALLYLAILVIFIAPYIPFLGLMMGHFLNWTGELLLEFLKFVENLPYAVVENLYPSGYELALATLFFILAAIFIKYKKGKVALLALVNITVLLLINDIILFNTLSRKEVVVFNIPGKTLLAFTKGRETQWLTSEKSGSLKELNYFTKPYEGYRKIKKSTFSSLYDTSYRSNRILTMKKNFLYHAGLKMYLFNNAENKNSSFEDFPKYDIVLIDGNSTSLSREHFKNSPGSVFINTRSPLVLRHPQQFNDEYSSMDEIVTNENKAIKISIDPLSDDGKIRFRTGYFNDYVFDNL